MLNINLIVKSKFKTVDAKCFIHMLTDPYAQSENRFARFKQYSASFGTRLGM